MTPYRLSLTLESLPVALAMLPLIAVRTVTMAASNALSLAAFLLEPLT